VKNFLKRTITGAIFVACIIGSILYDPFTFAGLILIFTLLATSEFYRFYHSDENTPQKITGMICVSTLYLILALIARNSIPIKSLFLCIPVFLCPFIIELYRKKNMPFNNIAITILPLIYIAIPMASLNFLFSPWHITGEFYPNILLGFFVITWTADTMAYLGGMALGKHRLFERISPKKSWEGSISGALFAIGMAWLLSLFFKEYTYSQWMGMAGVIIVAGTFGDLIESMLKRSVNVKDSGNLLPGHGGFLDRFDSVLFSAPFVFLYINLINGTL
jgi:phosphatidate cytidylyltransferase